MAQIMRMVVFAGLMGILGAGLMWFGMGLCANMRVVMAARKARKAALAEAAAAAAEAKAEAKEEPGGLV